MALDFYSIPFSPWSEKARWALDHHAIAYRPCAYAPLTGELRLRVRLRRLGGRVSAPVLFDGERAFCDSYEIAKHAEAIGSGATLFPSSLRVEMEQMNALSERAMAAGRSLAMRRLRRDRAALGAFLPWRLQKRLGRWAPSVASLGVALTMRKYGCLRESAAAQEQTLRTALDTLSQSLTPTAGGPDTLFGRFTYADIAMAQVLCSVLAKPMGGFRITAAAARVFSHPGLADDYPHLLRWRDALYARYRKSPAGRQPQVSV